MLNLSALAKLEKNKIMSGGPLLLLLEITVSPSVMLRLCNNNEDITWNGETWVAFPFKLDDYKQTSGNEFPQLSLSVSNITRTVEGYLEQTGGMVGATVRAMVVMAAHLEDSNPIESETFTVQSTAYNQEWVTFKLSGVVNLLRRVPERRFLKNWCPFQYKGPECRATSSLASCDKSLKNCQERGNAKRFGGEPAIPMGGIYNARD